jgi:hypothetical protein
MRDAGPEIRNGLGVFLQSASDLLARPLEDRVALSSLIDSGGTRATILGIGDERFALVWLW